MKKISFLLLLIMQSILVLSQMKVDNNPGYIITLQHDTIHGEIPEYPNSYLSKQVDFIKNNSTDRITYSPKDLAGFHLEPNKDFITVSVKENTVEDKYFALKIIKGEVELLVLTLNNLKEKYFVKSDQFGVTELEQIIEKDDNIQTTNDKYKVTLGKYFYKHPEFQQRIAKCDFRFNSLKKIIEEYNANFEKEVFILEERNLKWNIVPHAGADYYFGEKIDNYYSPFGMVMGLKNSFYPYSRNLQIEFVVGFNYRFYSFKKDVLVSFKEGYKPTTYEYFLHRQRTEILEFPFYLEYNKKTQIISPIVQVGLKPFLMRKDVEIVNLETYDTDWDLNRKLIFGFGLGVNYKRMAFKYVVHLDPRWMNSFGIDFLLHQKTIKQSVY